MGRVIGWFITFCVVLLAAGCALTYCNAASAVATAPARVVTRTFETDNIIHNYEWFFDYHSEYKSRLSQFQQAREAWQSETDADEKRRLAVEMRAVQSSCRELANDYNANAQKVNRNIFKNGTPPSLDASECEIR